jgi:hypothetical protein
VCIHHDHDRTTSQVRVALQSGIARGDRVIRARAAGTTRTASGSRRAGRPWRTRRSDDLTPTIVLSMVRPPMAGWGGAPRQLPAAANLSWMPNTAAAEAPRERLTRTESRRVTSHVSVGDSDVGRAAEAPPQPECVSLPLPGPFKFAAAAPCRSESDSNSESQPSESRRVACI